MDNRVLLAQARTATVFRINQSPDVVIRRVPVDASDPFSRTVATTDVARLSHERNEVHGVTGYPSGLDTSLSLYLQWRWDQTYSENDVIQARGNLHKVGSVDALIKFGGVIGYQSTLYPAGDASGLATSVSLNGTSPIALAPLATYQLIATILPATAVQTLVYWVSSNPSVATVSSSGLVTAVSPGTSSVTVTTHDGSFTAVRAFEVGT